MNSSGGMGPGAWIDAGHGDLGSQGAYAGNILYENNDILIEENGVNRELMLRIFQDLHKEPPTDLMVRLANLDARRHQVSVSSRAATHPLEMLMIQGAVKMIAVMIQGAMKMTT